MKENSNEMDSQNPYLLLLHQLTGTQPKRPRLKTAANIWRKTCLPEIEKEVQRRAVELGWAKSKLAPLREKVTKELYDALPQGDKDKWSRLAKEDHDDLLKKHEEGGKIRPGADPASRQRCIQGLTEFVTPLLDFICEGTGWKASLIAGGPEPAYEGRLNVVCFHSGTTSEDVKTNFESSSYLNRILPIYSDFLRKCYTSEESKSRALPEVAVFEKMMDSEVDESFSINMDTVPETQDANLSSRRTLGLECSLPQSSSRSASPESASPYSEASTPYLDESVLPHHSPPKDAALSSPVNPPPSRPIHIDGPEIIRPCALRANEFTTSQTPSSAIDSCPKTRGQTRKDAAVATSPIIPSKRHQTDADELPLPPPNKRSRKSSSQQTADTPLDSMDVKEPKWFSNGINMFMTLKLGHEWTRLVEEWTHFERAGEFY